VRNGQAAEPRPAFRVSGTFGPFLASTRYCDCGHPSILAMASMLCAEGGSERAIAVRLFRFVRDHVEYAFTPWGVSASTTLAWRRGTCSNKNNLLVALLRAAGVPAAYGVLRVNAREYFGNLAPPFLKPFASVTSTHIYAAAHLGGRWVKCDASTDREIAGKTAHFCRQTQLVEWDGIHDAQEFLDPSHIHQDLGLRPVVDDLLAKQPRNATAALFAILNDYLQFIRAEAAFASAEELLDAYVRAPARGELRP
jgi:transglutaminase-like putative cysteine protease